MRASSDKVQLSFNAGEYSPFLDSRVDIEKASSATRTMRNFLAEVGGTARRRPGLRFVLNTQPGLPDTSSSGVELANYIEIPFLQRMAGRFDPADSNVTYNLEYRGLVRVWESGTVEFVGECGDFRKLTLAGGPISISEISYKVWFGIEHGVDVGTLETVATIPTSGGAGVWYPVDWSGRMSAGESTWILPDIPGTVGAVTNPVKLWEYPTGLMFPIEGINGGLPLSGTGATAAEISRSGNDLVVDWAYQSNPGPTTGHHIWSWELDSTDWSRANFIQHMDQYGISIFADSGTETRTIPDSATVGLRFFIGQSIFNEYLSTFDVGPFFRTAYSTPEIQQGIDPEA